ncbi:MAG: ribosome recycling factor [Actinomycetota bacterium]|nr:MAG: ribosome recycling factor [Actinomycetota bacterium]
MEDSIVSENIDSTREKMARAISHAQQEFANVRTGRASPALVERIPVEYYGSHVPLQQIAGISVPEAKVLLITPYDRGALSAIEKAIQTSDIGINPSNDGQIIRLVFPTLNAERRKELVKVVRAKAEDARVAIRNLRRASRHELEVAQKDGKITTDDLDRAEKDLDKVTSEHIGELDKMLATKEKELLEV